MKNYNSRFIDVIMALKVAKDYHQTLGRIQLQKYIYLSDTISIVWDVLAPKEGHETYKHGPFDEAINNAVDILSFRGVVDVKSINIEENKVDALYELNQIGLKLFEEMTSEANFKNKIDLYHHIGDNVNRIGWKKLINLVYKEPTYVQSRAEGYGYKFNYMSLFDNQTIRILYQFEEMIPNGQKITRKNMVSLFFKLLS